MHTQLDHKQDSFIRAYSGQNRFILSLKSQYEKKGTLTDRQISYLGTFISNQSKQTQSAKPIEEKETAMQQKQTGMFSLETLETEEIPSEAQQETPMLNNIEATLNKIAGKVVEETLEKASARMQVMLQHAQKIAASNKVVMHVRVGDTKPKELTHEAHELLPKLITTVKLGFNPLLVGPKGCGKTTLAAQLAEALGLPFGHIGLTAGASETWLAGRQLPTGFMEAEFSKFYKNGGVFLLDELDAADPNLIVFLNAALANGHFYNPILGENIKRHKDFVCVAAANTFGLGANAEYTARNRLDGASLDRFPIFEIEYNEKLEAKLCPNTGLLKRLQEARKKLQGRNATQTVSTRQIGRIAKLVEAGFSEREAIETMTASFPKGLAEEVGLLDKNGKNKKDEEIAF